MVLPGGWELVLIVVVIMLLFGFKRLPSAARDLGRSLHILRTEVNPVIQELDDLKHESQSWRGSEQEDRLARADFERAERERAQRGFRQ